MYENMTYEYILKRALDRVSGSIDKREGSILYNALAPAAAELAQMYIECNTVLNEGFADTASREYLVKRALESGLAPSEAVKARVKGVFNINIPLGSRFNQENLNYTVVEKIADNTYLLECETAGREGSRMGALVPIDYIDGLEAAAITEILTHGADAEDTEHFRERFLLGTQRPSTSGNAYHYEQWALEVQGVGRAKAVPLANGAGTVGVLIVDADMLPADTTLCTTCKAHIEEVRPIGAAVTVSAPAPVTVNVAVNVVLAGGVVLDSVKERYAEKVKAYLKSIALRERFVSLALIGSMLLDVEGVLDYADLKLNGSVANVRVENNQVAVLGSMEVSV